MLFVIAMDVLSNQLYEAENCNLLQPIEGQRGIPHRLSLYADDVAVVLTPALPDLQTIKEILHIS